jgi:hypothetical protein
VTPAAPISDTPAPLVGAIDYQASTSGPFLWQAFDRHAVNADLARIAQAGFSRVRIGLAWDSFMPDARGVDPRRLAEFEWLLRSATGHGLGVVPVLFVQSHGDCVFLPARTVLRRGARPGVRVFSQGLLEPGGPRDVWTDPLMLEIADTWLRTLVGGFANHPGIAAWDLGDDPATTVRPRRLADLGAWVAMMGAPLRRQGDRVQMTLGAGDVLMARGVRLDTVAAHVDQLDIAVRPLQLSRLGLSDAEGMLLLAGLAQRMIAGTGTRLGLAMALPIGAGEAEIDEPAAARLTDELIARGDESGLVGLRPTRWSDLGENLAGRAPFDRSDWMRHCGLTASGGSARAALEVWSRALRTEAAAGPAQPWPPALDVAEYYAALPESIRDLAGAWRRERDNQPAILDRSEG